MGAKGPWKSWAGEKPQASTFFLLLLSRQSWFSYIGGRREGARKSNGWLVGSFTTFTHAPGIRTITLSVGTEGGTLGQEKKTRWLGLFRSDHSLNVRGTYFSFLSLCTQIPCQIGGAGTLLSRRGARRQDMGNQGRFPLFKKYF